MSKQQRLFYNAVGVLLGGMIILGFLKYINLYWVESNTIEAKVTINFLFPMEQIHFSEHIQIISKENDQSTFGYSINWINNHTVELIFKEQGNVKGKKVTLKINNAPSQYKRINKCVSIPIQFKADIQLTSSNQFLISSTNSFIVTFNTPISLQQLCQSLQCKAEFDIRPYQNTNETQFIFTPKKALNNGENYELLFKAGMRSKSGTLLNEDQSIILEVDKKPTITKTYPINGDKWIGLYPRILLESQEDIVKASACINGSMIQGKLINSKHACFLLDNLLQPDTTYHLTFQVQADSGELSEVRQIDFTTTTLKQKRFWLDIHVGDLKEIRCYEGEQCIRTISFEMSQKIDDLLLGTYYLQGKSEVYEDEGNHLGGNCWMNISNQLGIQGVLRDSYWNPTNDIKHAKNMIISDEEALWLYNIIEEDTMVIVRR